MILALSSFVAWALVDGYQVRGNSMQPLLVDRKESPDRVFAIAHGFAFGGPQRFDLVVFDRPPSDLPKEDVVDVALGDRCVKRVIAFAGERPYIEGGDLFLEHDAKGAVTRERLRRPIAVIDQMIVSVATFEWVPQQSKWTVPSNAIVEHSSLVLTPLSQGGGATVQYEDPIRNDFIDRNGDLIAGSETVNDVGIEFDFEPIAEDDCVAIELREQADVFTVTLATRSALKIERRRGPGAPEACPTDSTALLPQRSCHVRALNCDDEILVFLDGSLVGRWSYQGNEPAVGILPNAPALSLLRGKARFSRITVIRDAYYTRSRVAGSGISDFPRVPDGGLFVLGDNSVNSVDSRDFGPIEMSTLSGRPIARYRVGEGLKGL